MKIIIFSIFLSIGAQASFWTEYSIEEKVNASARTKQYCLTIDETQRCSLPFDVSTPIKEEFYHQKIDVLIAALSLDATWKNKKCAAKQTLNAGFDLGKAAEHFRHDCGHSANESDLIVSFKTAMNRLRLTQAQLEKCSPQNQINNQKQDSVR
jgi:hypothetical protein